jgi:hypothetical protein
LLTYLIFPFAEINRRKYNVIMTIRLCPDYRFKIELTEDAPKSMWKEIESLCLRQNVHRMSDGWWYSADVRVPRERLLLAGAYIEDKIPIEKYLVSWVYVRTNPYNPAEWLEEDWAMDIDSDVKEPMQNRHFIS